MATSLWASIIKAARVAAVLAVLAGCAQAPYPEDLDRPLDPETPPTWKEDLGRALEMAPVMRRSRAYLAVTDETLECLDARTGEQYWDKGLEGAPILEPALTPTHVIVATGYPKPHVMGFDAASGEELWKRRKHIMSCTALVGEDRVLVGLDDGRWECLDSGSGDTVWSRKLGGHWGGRALALPGRVWIPQAPDSLVVLDSQTGEARPGMRSLPVPSYAAGDGWVVVLDERGNLEVRDPESLERLHALSLNSAPAGPPTPAPPGVWISLRDGRLISLSASDWSVDRVLHYPAPLVCAPAAAGGVILQPLPRGEIVLVDAGSGREVDRWQHPERILATPGVSEDWILVPGSHGTLTAYPRP